MDITQIIAIIIGGGGVFAYWQAYKAIAEASKIYQDMAHAETKERERLEAKFEKEIEALHKNRKALEGRLVALKTELDALKKENIDLRLERDDLYNKIAKQQSEIMKLQKRIKELEKKQTGQLG